MGKPDIYFHTAPVSEHLPVMNNMIPVRLCDTTGIFLISLEWKMQINFSHTYVRYFRCAKAVLNVFSNKGKVEDW